MKSLIKCTSNTLLIGVLTAYQHDVFYYHNYNLYNKVVHVFKLILPEDGYILKPKHVGVLLYSRISEICW